MADLDIKDLDKRLAVHEKECAERWKTIFSRMEVQEKALGRIETLIITVGGTIIVGGASVIFTILMMHN
jgi:hypothetical protein